METLNFSKNKKLNLVLNSIYGSLIEICETKEESVKEIRRYKSEFPNETDYNLYQYGNLLIYNDSIKSLYSDYKSLKNTSIDKLIDIYKRQVRYIANYILINDK